jgi:ribosomal protein L28
MITAPLALAKKREIGYSSATFMSRIDSLTGKRGNTANSRSHSNIATKRTQEVNLQTVRIGGVRVRVSTRTIKTLKKFAAIAKGEMQTKRQKKQAKTAARVAKKQTA